MSNAWDKAVEAGADTWPRGPDFHLWIARKQTETVLRAAFPILAEEMVVWHDEQAASFSSLAVRFENSAEVDRMERIAETHRQSARSLRTRIQQLMETT
jgi:hypothetical protein